MKSTIKIMLLGIALMLAGFYLNFNVVGFILLFVGFIIVICGFFLEEHKKDLTEETYNMVLQQKIKDENELTCKKCGKKYKEGYTSCPWCGHKDE